MNGLIGPLAPATARLMSALFVAGDVISGWVVRRPVHRLDRVLIADRWYTDSVELLGISWSR